MGEWVFANADAVARVAASRISQVVNTVVRGRGVCRMVLSGGRTPLGTYQALSGAGLASEVPWDKLHLFWGDERCVALEDPASNAGEALRTLGVPAGLPRGNIHPINGKLGPAEGARAYEQLLREHFDRKDGGPPMFDLVLLGLGADGHVASLFPGDQALGEASRWAMGVHPPEGVQPNVDRITLTLPVINAARNVIFLVTGAEKHDALNRAREGDPQCPAALVRPSREPVWIIDEAAAGYDA